ncbi:hypothetical protein ACN28C_06375 [Plantactinospora sp. WMMC1484]|uniref:hypothetical protein n=1 Tax=Plantactinospora sp. WMMC1484 TaxID=3404122 RepID=UPI003BF466CB
MAQPDEDFAPGDHLTPDERDPEAPPADAVEQATVADPSVEDQPSVQRGLEVDEWDAMEQARVVGLQDDDYR